MKLLFVLPEYYPHSGGGISTYYQELIPALLPFCSKIKVIVGSGYTQGGSDINLHGVEVTYLKINLFKKHVNKLHKFKIFPEFRDNLAAAWAMWEQAKDEDFDIVECTDFGLGFIPWLVHHNRPVKIQLHGSTGQISFFDPFPSEALSRDITRQTELVFFHLANLLQTHSSNNQAFWQEQLPQKKIHVLLPVYKASNPKTSFHERFTFGVVTGRVQHWKGPTIVCDAAQLLKNKMPKIEWVGRNMPYKSTGTNMGDWLSKKYPDVWNEYIVPTGAKNIKEVKKMQANARFGLIPSLWDMFNFSCLEFLASGTLTICADGAGACELIENGKNGFTYNANDAQSLANILMHISHLKEVEYDKIALLGQETVKELLSSTTHIVAYIEAYQKTIESFNQSPINPYLQCMYDPSETSYKLDYILDKQPLEELMSYSAKRVGRKIWRN